jgi:RNA polymerase sigma factor (sigma-70 family)
MSTTNGDRPGLKLVKGITQAERHRLVSENTDLVEPIAAEFRGSKNIPFEDMLAQGMFGLVVAAKYAERARDFRRFAAACIRNAIRRQIRLWQPLVTPIDPDNDSSREFWEWSIWSFAAPYEQWTSLCATPEQIVADFDELSKVLAAFNSAMIGLDDRSRGILRARFFRQPQPSVDSIAREYRISYAKTIWIIKRALKTVREKLENSQRNSAA